MLKKELLGFLEKEGFSNQIITAISKVPREDFVPLKQKFNAYKNEAIHLADGSSISQPSTIAFMLQELDVKPTSKILEIGSGSGYALALLAEMAPGGEIRGIELNDDLVEKSKERLKKHQHIHIHKVNGRGGFLRYAPYDRILVSAAYPYVPYNLLDQLKINGVMVVPVGNHVVRLRKRIDGVSEKEFPGFAFVKMK
ncbi:methyltransferase domain-containing protein [Candidatus Woesearchaeota archaeon]|nr:methyltransferase domain-containing protein [Candidatus Woesearchaeota archaeon]